MSAGETSTGSGQGGLHDKMPVSRINSADEVAGLAGQSAKHFRTKLREHRVSGQLDPAGTWQGPDHAPKESAGCGGGRRRGSSGHPTAVGAEGWPLSVPPRTWAETRGC